MLTILCWKISENVTEENRNLTNIEPVREVEGICKKTSFEQSKMFKKRKAIAYIPVRCNLRNYNIYIQHGGQRSKA